MKPRLKLRLFGDVQFDHDDLSPPRLHSRKALAVLGYLAAASERVPRATLAQLLWPTFSRSHAATNLNWIISRLNRLLPDCLDHDRQLIGLSATAAVWIDAVAFHDLMDRSDIPSCMKAIEIYCGPFLQNLALSGCPDFEAWLHLTRQRFHSQALCALEAVIDQHRKQSSYAEALRYAKQLIALDRGSEKPYCLMIELLLSDRRPAEAQEYYEACCRILRTELRRDPSSELLAWQAQIQAMEQGNVSAGNLQLRAPSTKQHGLLPSAHTLFVGRTRELEELAACLQGSSCRLLTIVAPGGTGKTRLAMELIAQVLARFPDGVCFVPLASIPTPEGVAGAITEALGLVPAPDGHMKAQLLHTLHSKQQLLILDNFEHLLGATDLVLELLNHAPGISILVTSRERLHLQAEQVFVLTGLIVLDLYSPTTIQECSAVELFLTRRRWHGMGVPLTDEQLALVMEICRLVDGSPLGIELAASWAAQLSLDQIVENLRNDIGSLTSNLQDLPERHRSLRAVFEGSWQLLSSQEQRTLAQLAIFHGRFHRDEALAVTGASLSDLIGLMHRSLLRPIAQQEYELHEVIRCFAAQQLEQMLELYIPLGRRHCLHYLALAESYDTAPESAKSASWLAGIERIYANLRAALQWCLESAEAELGLRLAGALGKFWRLHGYINEGPAWYAALLALDGPVAPTVLAKALHCAGLLAAEINQYEQARDYYDTALSLYRQLQDAVGVGWVLNSLGYLAAIQGKYEQAQVLWDEALRICRPNNDREGIVRVLICLSLTVVEQHEYARAQVLYKELLDLLQELDNREQLAITFNNLGYLHLLQGAVEQAKSCFERCLVLCPELHFPRLTANAKSNLGTTALHIGDIAAAYCYLQEALHLFQSINHRIGIAECLISLAAIAQAQGNLDRAACLCGTAAGLLEALKVPMYPYEQALFARTTACLKATLGETAFFIYTTHGRALSLSQAILYATSPEVSLAVQASPVRGGSRPTNSDAALPVAGGLLPIVGESKHYRTEMIAQTSHALISISSSSPTNQHFLKPLAQLPQPARRAAKAQLVQAMNNGLSWRAAASAVGVVTSEATAYRLRRRMRQEGPTALNDRRRGSSYKLSQNILDWLIAYCRTQPHTPSHTLQSILFEQFDVCLSIGYLNQIRADQGVSYIRRSKKKAEH